MVATPNIRINLSAPFPSLVTGSGGIGVAKSNGNWVISYSPVSLPVQSPPPASTFPTSYVTVYNNATGQSFNVPLSAIGSPILCNTLTASNSANLQDITSLGLGFNDYQVVLENIVPATNNVSFEMQVQSAGVFQTTGYLNSAGGLTNCVDILEGATLGNTAGKGYSGDVKIYGNPASTNINKIVRGLGTFNTGSSASAAGACSGFWNGGAGALTGLQFLMSSGNISSGTIKIYGWF